jgi:hypothetical protein
VLLAYLKQITYLQNKYKKIRQTIGVRGFGPFFYRRLTNKKLFLFLSYIFIISLKVSLFSCKKCLSCVNLTWFVKLRGCLTLNHLLCLVCEIRFHFLISIFLFIQSCWFFFLRYHCLKICITKNEFSSEQWCIVCYFLAD